MRLVWFAFLFLVFLLRHLGFVLLFFLAWLLLSFFEQVEVGLLIFLFHDWNGSSFGKLLSRIVKCGKTLFLGWAFSSWESYWFCRVSWLYWVRLYWPSWCHWSTCWLHVVFHHLRSSWFTYFGWLFFVNKLHIYFILTQGFFSLIN